MTEDILGRASPKVKDIAKTAIMKSIFGTDAAIGDRQIRVVASTPTPDRVRDVMVPDGCDLTNYQKNPIVLADHNPSQPIGTADVAIKNGRVEALITFAPAGASQKADEYCALAKAGVLNTVSVGFTPTVANPIKGGGFSIEQWELMELSLVAVPCNPDAVVMQRSFDPRPANWKCGASLGLPIRDRDGEIEDILVKAGFSGDERRDIRFAAKGFLAYDSSNAGDAGAYAIQFANVVDGRLMVDAESIKAAREELIEANLPEDVAAKADAVLKHYEGKMSNKSETINPARKKSLWNVSDLASALNSLRYVQQNVAWESDDDSDSEVSAMLFSAIQQVGQALIALTQDEVSELIASAGGAKAFSNMVKSAGNAPHVETKTAPAASSLMDKFDEESRERELELLRLKAAA